MQYELVKYKYGVGGKYTAFALVPLLKRPRTVKRGEVTWQARHNGLSSRGARHFQTPSAAKTWLDSQKIDGKAFDWSVLPATSIWPSVLESEVEQLTL